MSAMIPLPLDPPRLPEEADNLVLVGPAVADGLIELKQVAYTLQGFGALTERVDKLLNGERYRFRAALRPPERGSVIIPVELISHAAQGAERLLTSQSIEALVNLKGLLDLGVSAFGVFHFFKFLKGRKIKTAEDIKKIMPANVQININVNSLQTFRIYNDPEVQAAIRQTLRPLREEGIAEFRTQKGGQIVSRITKDDLFAADQAEIDELVGEEFKDLLITKVALAPNLAWHFNDGDSSYDARVEDQGFLEEVAGGRRFGQGDRLRVVMRTSATRLPNGRLRIEHLITKVFKPDEGLEFFEITDQDRGLFDS